MDMNSYKLWRTVALVSLLNSAVLLILMLVP